MKKIIQYWPFLLLAILIANIFVVQYGRTHYPVNWTPESVSFMENYMVWCLFELGCVFFPLIIIIAFAFIIISAKELLK